MMKYEDYSHRHDRKLLQLLHPSIFKEVLTILKQLEPFAHGAKKGKTVKEHIAEAFVAHGWEKEARAEFGTDKKDSLDLCKWKDKVAIEMEFSRFEIFFRDFFRFMLLYEKQILDVGIIMTFHEMAYRRWQGDVRAYKSARASLQKLVDFLEGDYSSVVTVPLWCIGIE